MNSLRQQQGGEMPHQGQQPPVVMPQGMMMPGQFGSNSNNAPPYMMNQGRPGHYNYIVPPNFPQQMPPQVLMQQMPQQMNTPQSAGSSNGPPMNLPQQGSPVQAQASPGHRDDSAIKEYEKQLKLMESQNRKRMEVHKQGAAAAAAAAAGLPHQAQDFSSMVNQFPHSAGPNAMGSSVASPRTQRARSPGKKKRSRKAPASVPVTPITPHPMTPTAGKRRGASAIREGKEVFAFERGTTVSEGSVPRAAEMIKTESDRPSSTLKDDDELHTHFTQEFEGPNDIFDFDSLLGAQEGNMGLKEVFNWGESVETHEL